MNSDFLKGKATFVMAHWRQENIESCIHLEQAIEGIYKQTDENWQLIIVDGRSPCQEVIDHLQVIASRDPDKIKVIFSETYEGAGITRNLGIKWAYDNDSPIILFNDADDISDPKRLEKVRKIFVENPEAAVVYSTFKVIDENGHLVSEQKLTPSVLEILEGHKTNPLQGKNVWIEIGTSLGYTNLTSSTAVKTSVAYQYPFPSDLVSEDQHTWFRYSAGGGSFIYSGEIPSLYRISQGTSSASRTRFNDFYSQKADADTRGFLEAMNIAEEKKSISSDKKDDLLIRFYVKLAETLAREKQEKLAIQQIAKAAAISKVKTQEILTFRKLEDKNWAFLEN